MAKEITDLEQLDNLVVGEEIPFYSSESGLPEGLRLVYTFCWKDEYKGKEIMVFASGMDSTHIGAYIAQKDWFRIVDGFGLVMKQPGLEEMEFSGRSFGYSYMPEDGREFGILFKALIGKNPTNEEMELFRKGSLYTLFFREE